MCTESHPYHSTVLFNLATAKFVRGQEENNLNDINVAIELYRDAFQFRISDYPGRCGTALDLCFALLAHLQTEAQESEEAPSRVMVTLAYRVAWLALQMAGIVVSVQSVTSGISDPDHESLIWRSRVELRNMSYGDPRRPAVLAMLGLVLSHRLECNDEYVESHEAISALQYAVHVPESPDKADGFGILGKSLHHRFQRLDDITDIDKAISMKKAAVCLTPDGHPHKAARLGELGNSISIRFERFGDVRDIDKSISTYNEALCLAPNGHPDKPAVLTNLGASLITRFERRGNRADIDRAILMTEEAVRLTPNGHPSKPGRLNRLGAAYFHRFCHLGNLNDIMISISMSKKAINLTPDDDPEMPTRLCSFASALSLRFQHLGNLADIDKSIWTSEKAVRLASNVHRDKPRFLSNLGNSLLHRFKLFHDVSDIEKAVSIHEEAVGLTPSGHPDKPSRLSNLGGSLFRRFEHLGDLADIDKSILTFEAAISLIADDHPDKVMLLNNLGTSLSNRFSRLGHLADINRSISVIEKAEHLTLAPDAHPRDSLGNALIFRFDRLGDLADVDRAILIYGECVSITPDGHPAKSDRLDNLGNAFKKRFERSHDPSDLSAAASNVAAASSDSSGRTSTRFQAARRWMYSSRLQNDHQALLDACTTAIELLPQLAWVGLTLRERHRVLLEAADVARDAAAAAVDANFPDMAVEWLEQGRSIVWSQFLQLRTPVDELRGKHPTLADQFQQVSKALEHAGSLEDGISNKLANGVVGYTVTKSVEKEVQRHHGLALTREKLLAEIRSLPGFDHFFLPKKLEQLAASAFSGPVVYLNASKERCDALIVKAESETVVPVPLPGVSYRDVSASQGLLRLSLERGRLVFSRNDILAAIPAGETRDLASHQFLNSLTDDGGVGGVGRAVKAKPQKIEGYTPDDLFEKILAHLWNSVVKPVLEALGFSTPPSDPTKMSRIFWCPTGPFAFLPIHAAGLYGTTEAGTKLSDFAISSYIPNLGALASAEKSANDASSNIHFVAVPQPASDGQSRLSCVREEIDHLKSMSTRFPFVSLEESDGCVEDVVEKMKNADWVHFACHGIQDPHEPLNSGLCLSDGRRLKLLDIVRLSRPQGGLAFLSACQTAQGDETLSEESVHLAAGMLLAGYSGVIATMWAIEDSDAPKVTKDVYGHLFRDGRVPDCSKAAEALHYAVQRLRASGSSFTSWVPFIHVGR